MQAVELSRENGFGGAGHDGVIVQNNPVNWVDPLGLYTWADVPVALINYCSENSLDWNTSISSVNWGDAKARAERKVRDKLDSICAEGRISLNFIIESQTEGADSKIIGRHNLRVKGTAIMRGDGSWTFYGQISSAQGYDTYNFNPSNRDSAAEAQTTFGRELCDGNPFKINISGSMPLIISSGD